MNNSFKNNQYLSFNSSEHGKINYDRNLNINHPDLKISPAVNLSNQNS